MRRYGEIFARVKRKALGLNFLARVEHEALG